MNKKMLLLLMAVGAVVLLSGQGDAATKDEGYGFARAKDYLEQRDRELTDFQNRLDNDTLENLDAANSIILKYDAVPPEYVLYRLKIEEDVTKNAANKQKLDKYCDDFVFVDKTERSFSTKIQAYRDAVAEKFIDREMYQLMGDDQTQKALTAYLSEYNVIYGFNDPDSIKVKVEKATPYKTVDGDFGVYYFVYIDAKDASGAYMGDRPYQFKYYHGEVVYFEQSTDDDTDTAALKFCKDRR